MHFLSAYFIIPVTVKQASYQSNYIFPTASIILKWEQPLKTVTFSQKDFSKYLLVSSNFLFLITTPWRQILFLISYFLKINTFSAELPFRRSVPSRISNYSENALFSKQALLPNFSEKKIFRRRYFLKRVTFYDSSVPVDAGRKLNVHRTFRRRPGRLLNVLCTFNLRPVSTRV